VIDVTGLSLNARIPICVRFRVAASEGKKTEEGMMTSQPEPEYDTIVADPPDAQTSTPEAAEQVSDILTKCEMEY
jgi:hypothetical protein